MAKEEIWIGENDIRRKLEGDELAEFLAHREAANTKRQAEEAAEIGRINAKISAQTKLAALGLTADEIAALIP